MTKNNVTPNSIVIYDTGRGHRVVKVLSVDAENGQKTFSGKMLWSNVRGDEVISNDTAICDVWGWMEYVVYSFAA